MRISLWRCMRQPLVESNEVERSFHFSIRDRGTTWRSTVLLNNTLSCSSVAIQDWDVAAEIISWWILTKIRRAQGHSYQQWHRGDKKSGHAPSSWQVGVNFVPLSKHNNYKKKKNNIAKSHEVLSCVKGSSLIWISSQKYILCEKVWFEEMKRRQVPWTEFEPEFLRPQRRVLTTTRSRLCLVSINKYLDISQQEVWLEENEGK